ncbi:hypothetical protein [Methylobacterium brachiatum]|nr:hypothetical protein [Methylobacterium brachiatum]
MQAKLGSPNLDMILHRNEDSVSGYGALETSDEPRMRTSNVAASTSLR